MKVLIIEDHQMVAESLRRALSGESEIEVVGVEMSAGDGIAAAARLRPDVVLLDYRLPDGAGTGPVRGLRDASPRSRIVMMSGFGHVQIERAALAAGCVSYVEKTEGLARLAAAIIQAAKAGNGAATGKAAAAEHEGTVDAPEGAGRLLTARELEVLDLLAIGTGSRDLGLRLGISVYTVRKHVQTILTKLGAHSKLEAVAVARREGLIA